MKKKIKTEIRKLLYSLYGSKKLTKTSIKLWLTLIIHEKKKKIMSNENSKTSEPHRFKLNLTEKHNLKDPKKNMALTNLSIYYTWKNI